MGSTLVRRCVRWQVRSIALVSESWMSAPDAEGSGSCDTVAASEHSDRAVRRPKGRAVSLGRLNQFAQ